MQMTLAVLVNSERMSKRMSSALCRGGKGDAKVIGKTLFALKKKLSK
ncbi:hypothetical protein UVI_02009720 [Ustilaginoidea virens]|uniref:Uncharacterized protein n=1 Tax=Ustilaginoidea virens TaxID=1159556 RepID=A0A1B5L787_USTVR|nr:hypothetical protein UVI_02009720 [Ustilaginoidea virens]